MFFFKKWLDCKQFECATTAVCAILQYSNELQITFNEYRGVKQERGTACRFCA